jgi:PAS domain S-box-containing protein
MKSTPRPPPVPWRLAYVFAGITVLIALLGWLLYYFDQQEDRTERQQELQTIADLKTNQIVQWRSERLADAKFFHSNLYFAGHVRLLLNERRNVAYQNIIRHWLAPLKMNHDYRMIALMDQQEKELFRIGDSSEVFGPRAAPSIGEAKSSRRIQFSDIYFADATHTICLDLVVPISQSGELIALLVFRIDPYVRLYPILRTWPVNSRTAETLIVRHENNEVVFLNDFRHRVQTPLTYRLPDTLSQVPAVQAVRGFEGVTEGPDYRGERVLADVRPVPHSPWFLITKMDRSEVFAGAAERARWTFTTMIALILAGASGVGLWWRHQRARWYRNEWEAEAERKALLQHFAYLVRYANDIILLTTEGGTITEFNDRALEAYGYSREEMLQLNFHDLRASDTAEPFYDLLNRVVRNRGLVFETVHRRKNGSSFPVELSTRLIELEGLKYLQFIIRDITERKTAQRRIEQLNRAYALLSEVNQMIVRTSERGVLFHEACRIAVEIGGFRLAWVALAERGTDRVGVAASCGPAAGYLESIEVTRSASPNGQGPTGTALRTGRPDVCNDIARDPRMEPWREAAARFGLRASGAFPLTMFGEPVGTVNLYSDTAGLFDEKETRLFAEMASDLSYALEHIQREHQRMEAESALRDSEAKYRMIVEYASDSILLADNKGNCLDVNPATRALLGYSANEIRTLNVRDVVKTDGDQPLRLDELRAGKVLVQRRELVTRDRSLVPVQISAKMLPNGNLLTIARDFTDILRAEQALRQALTRAEELQSIIDRSPAVAFRWRAAEGWPIEFVSPNVAQFGYAADELIARSERYDTLIHPDDVFRVRQVAVEHARSGMSEFSQQYRLLTPEGDVRWVEGRTWIRSDSRGRIQHYEGIVYDISMRKEAEQAYVESESRYQKLVELSTDGIFTTDDDGRFTFVNSRLCRMLGYDAGELMHMNIADTYRPEERSDAVRHRSEASTEATYYERTILRKDGTSFPVELSLQRVESGRFLAFVRDITDRKSAEEAIRQSEERYRHLFTEMLEGCVLFDLIVDAKGGPAGLRCLQVNPAFERLSGYQADDVVGRTLLEVIPDMEGETIRKVGEVALSGRAALFEHYSPRLKRHFDIAAFCPRTGQLALIISDATERIVHERNLERSELTFRLLFENNPHPMWVYDLETLKFLAVNETAVLKYGYSKDEFLQMTLADIRPAAELEKFYEEMTPNRPAYQHTEGWHHRLKDGTVIDVDILSHTIEFEGRLAVLVIADDVTERKRAQRELRQSEERFRLALENSAIYMYHQDLDLRYTWAAKGTPPLRPEDIIGKTDAELLPREEGEELTRIKRSVLGTGRGVRSQIRMTIGGLPHDVDFSVEPLRDTEDRITGVVVVASDITDLLKARAALSESEQRFKQLTELLPQAVFEVDQNGRFTFVNRYAFEMIGYQESDLTGLTLFNLIVPEEHDLARDNMRKILAGTMKPGNRYTAVRKDGVRYPVMVYSTPVMVDGRFGGFRGIVIDLSDIEKAQRELSEKVEELRRFNQLMIGREMRMVHLKEEVNVLLKELGRPGKYRPIDEQPVES